MTREAQLFHKCNAHVQKLRDMAKEFGKGKLTRHQYSYRATKVVAALSILAERSERFDVVFPVIGFGEFSSSFWRWFNHWNRFGNGQWDKAGWSKSDVAPAFTITIIDE